MCVEGPAADHIVAFERQLGDQTVITIVSRLSATLLHDLPLIPPSFWEGTELVLPRYLQGRRMIEALADGAGACVVPEDGRMGLARILADLPVALLEVL